MTRGDLLAHFNQTVRVYEAALARRDARIRDLEESLRLEILTKETREARIRDLENELAIARAKERP